MSEIIETSHILIVDNENNLYLENNTRVNAIAMWWGKKEGNEIPIQTAVRELTEETGVLISYKYLQEVDTDNGEVVQWKMFRSVLYLLRITNKKTIATILANPKAFKTTVEELKSNPGPFVIEKGKFIARIEKALSLK